MIRYFGVLIVALILSTVANDAEGRAEINNLTTVTLQELKPWLAEELTTGIQKQVEDAERRIASAYTQTGWDRNLPWLLAASQSLQLSRRPLDCSILVQIAEAKNPDLAVREDRGEDLVLIDRLLGLAFVSDHCNRLLPCPVRPDETSVFRKVMAYYGDRSSTGSNLAATYPLDGLGNDRVSAYFVIVFYRYIPWILERRPMIYDIMESKLDGELSEAKMDYPVERFLALEIVNRFICKK